MMNNIELYALQHSTTESDLLKALVKETNQTMPAPKMLSGPIVGNLLKWLVSLSKAKNILEIGMFTGYATLCMALGSTPDSRIITCEIDQKSEAIARKYFSKSAVGHKIEIILGEALKTIEMLKNNLDVQNRFFPLDFVFIDADKINYYHYYEAVLPILNKGGIMVFDNALKGGAVLNPIHPGAKSVDKVNKAIIHNPELENILLTVRDGVNIVRKI